MSMFSSIINSVKSLGSGSSQDFPFTIGDEILEFTRSRDAGLVWKLHLGKQTTGNKDDVAIFVLDKKKSNNARIDAARNCVKKLKTTMHPHILKYLGGNETDTQICMVTEFVYPLSSSIDNIGNAQPLDHSFIALGLCQIGKALEFIHNKVGLIHARLTPSSIFVTKAGDWKLGGFELSHKYGNIPAHFSTNFDILPGRYKPKELSSQFKIDILTTNPINSLDSWCLGCMIYELFNSRFNKPTELSKIGKIPKDLQGSYKKLLATKAQSRLSMQGFLESIFFNHPLVHTSTFLEEIAIKNDKEKKNFLKHLNDNIEIYPPARCKYNILPALTHLLEHGSGSNPILLSIILKISKMLEENEKERFIRPMVINMFQNNERGTRLNLLKNLDKYIDYLDTKTVTKDIFPNVVNGFTDTSPILREASVRSALHFAKKLEQKSIHDKLLPILDKLQSSDPQNAIRTNTTIVLGKIAKYLNFKSAEPLLVKCFARALKDPFHLARSAGVSGLSVTMGLYSPDVLAKRVLPIIIMCTVDPYKVVRDPAYKCLDVGIQRLRQHALTLPDEPPKNINEQGGIQNNDNTAAPSHSKIGVSGSYMNNDDENKDRSAADIAKTGAKVVGTALVSISSWGASKITEAMSSSKGKTGNKSNNKSSSNASTAYGSSGNIGYLKSKPGSNNNSNNNNSNNNTNNNNNDNSNPFSSPQSSHTNNNNKNTPLRLTHRSKDTDEVDDIFATNNDPSDDDHDFFDDFGDDNRNKQKNNNNMMDDDLLSFETTKKKSNKKQKKKKKKTMASMENDNNDLNDLLSSIGNSSKKNNQPTGNLDDFFSDLGNNYSKQQNNNNDVLKSFDSNSAKKKKKKNKKKKNNDNNNSNNNDIDLFADDW